MQENNKDVAFVFMTNNFIRKSAKKSEDGQNDIWGKFSKSKECCTEYEK